MGLCEGFPSSIMPNHLGKADYHGVSVNMAARFTDAAAHGGQVACEEDLALRVFGSWEALVQPACPAPPVASPGDALLEVPEGPECDSPRAGKHSPSGKDVAGPSSSGNGAASRTSDQRSSTARSSNVKAGAALDALAEPASRSGEAWALPQQSVVEAAFVEITANHLGRFRCVGFPPLTFL